MKKIAVLVLLLASTAMAETETGRAYSEEELRQVIDEWQYLVVQTTGRYDSTSVRTFSTPYYSHTRTDTRPELSYGTFIYCVNALNRGEILYAFTYGERSKQRAWEKAIYALKLMGRCFAKPRVFHKQR